MRVGYAVAVAAAVAAWYHRHERRVYGRKALHKLSKPIGSRCICVCAVRKSRRRGHCASVLQQSRLQVAILPVLLPSLLVVGEAHLHAVLVLAGTEHPIATICIYHAKNAC